MLFLVVTANIAETCGAHWNLIIKVELCAKNCVLFSFQVGCLLQVSLPNPICTCPLFPLVPHGSPILSSFILSPELYLVRSRYRAATRYAVFSSLMFLSQHSLCSPLMRKTECHTQAAQQAKLHLITYHVIPIKPISLSLQTLYLVMQSKYKVRLSNTAMFANECRFIQLHLSIRTESSSGIHSYVLTVRDWIAHID